MFARTMLSTVFRCSRHSTAAFKHARIQHCARLYATVPENPGLNVDTSDKSTLYDKLRQNPVILGHLHKMLKILQDSGMVLDATKPPTTMQMMKMASNKEFLEIAMMCGQEMQKMGIDIKSPQVMMELMKAARGEA